MKILKEILLELKEIKKALQTIASSLECKELNKLPEIEMDSEGFAIKFPKKKEI